MIATDMKDLNRVRVIILNYNQPEVTLKCINSVLMQEYLPLDVVVVDNASSEDNFLLLQQGVPKEVTLLKNSLNSGYAAGNNYGIRTAPHLIREDFTLVLNNDAFFRHPNAISELVAAIYDKSELAAVSPLINDLNYSDYEKNPFTSTQVRRDANYISCIVSYSWFLRRLPVFKNIYKYHVYSDLIPYEANRIYECESINGCCFLIKTDMLEKIGYLDENTFLYFEEIILGRQLKLMNQKCCLLTSVIVDHAQGTNTKQKSNDINWFLYKEFIKSQIYYVREYLKVGIHKQIFLILVRLIDFISVKAVQKSLTVLRWFNLHMKFKNGIK